MRLRRRAVVKVNTMTFLRYGMGRHMDELAANDRGDLAGWFQGRSLALGMIMMIAGVFGGCFPMVPLGLAIALISAGGVLVYVGSLR